MTLTARRSISLVPQFQEIRGFVITIAQQLKYLKAFLRPPNRGLA